MALKKTHEQYVKEIEYKNPKIQVIEHYINTDTKILHKCKNCNYIFAVTPKHILSGKGCPICSKKRIGPPPLYKNSIWDSPYKDLAIFYGMTEEQMKTMMPKSNKKIKIICPNCKENKEIELSRLFDSGLGCVNCSDGISYPEKFIMSFLKQLEIQYKYQYSVEWSMGKRYDFFLPDYNCIIETHGRQHYDIRTSFGRIGGRTLEEEQKNDEFKKKIAFDNGIEHYVVLDCRKSNLDWMKNNILKNNLLDILNSTETDIDWNKCNLNAIKSQIKEAADLWNSNELMTVRSIAKIMNRSKTTILEWLKKATQANLCYYSFEEGKKRGILKQKEKCCSIPRKINQYDLNGNFIKTWESITTASKTLNVNRKSISDCCLKIQKKQVIINGSIL